MRTEYITTVHVIDGQSSAIDYTVVPMFKQAADPEAFLKGYGLGYQVQKQNREATILGVIDTVTGLRKIGRLTFRNGKGNNPDIMSGISAGAWQAGFDLVNEEGRL